jgi:hypothetical protein
VQRVATGPRDHLADRATQQRVAERERVLGGGHDRGVHRFLDRGQQHGRGLPEHLRRVFQPERRAEHRRGHQQVPCLRAEVIEPPLRESVNPPGQPGRRQGGASADDVHGMVVMQAIDQLGQEGGVAGGAAGQLRQGLLRRCAERLGEHARHRAVIQRGHRQPDGTVLLQQVEQLIRAALGGDRPGQEPRDRMPFQVPGPRPHRGQRGRAGPVQVIEADQDRSHRGPLLQLRSYPGHPPRRRVRLVTTGIVGGEPGERLTQGHPQREERDRPAQLARCCHGPGKAQPRCLVRGLAEQQGLADARLPVHQHHAAGPPLGTPQQVADHLLLRRTPAHDLPAGG